VINTTLNSLESQLRPKGFCRIHRGVLVNLSHVREYGEYPERSICLSNGDTLPLAKRRRQHFHNVFLSYKQR